VSAPFQRDAVAVRRALAAGLAAYVEAPVARAAVQLWVRDFEGRGNVLGALGRWCREVGARFGVAGREAELHLKVFRALQQPANELPDDPLASQPPPDDADTEPDRLDALPSQPPPLPPAISPSARLLMAFCNALEREVAREPAGGLTVAKLRRAWIAAAPGALPTGAQRAAINWWSGQVSQLAGDWAAAKLTTKLVNLVYVVLAEQLGPVAADRCFTAAVRALESDGDPLLRDIRRHL
jgi:hypothetical protein